MDIFLCLLLLIGLFYGTNAQINTYGCPEKWIAYQSTCYKFESQDQFYEYADAECYSHGAESVSVNTYGEHQFITEQLDKLGLKHMLWFTSGLYYRGKVFWNGDGTLNDDQGNTYWFNDKLPDVDSLAVYQVAYINTEQGWRWTNITSSTPSGSICEMSKTQAQSLNILNRDFDYGMGNVDVKEVRRGPIITEQPQDIYFFTGASFADLQCSSYGIPPPSYTWWRGTNISSPSQVTSLDSERYTLSAGKLTISNPEETADQNSYHCRAENDVGAVLSDYAKILFGYLHSFPNRKPNDVHATAFKGVKMECEAPSYSPNVAYQWFKNAATNIFVYAGNKNMFVSYDGSLYVSEVQPTDGPKNYFCVVTLIGTDTAALAKANPIGRSNRGILLLIDDSTSDNDYGPILHTNVFPKATVRGATIRMECIAYGSHPLSYTWYREDGREFAPGTKMIDRNRVLIINDAQLEASGNYVCRCSRSTGANKRKVITLNMESKPYFPYGIGNKFLDIGMSFEWFCKAVARPEATYSWFKNGRQLTTIPGQLEIRGNKLRLINVDKERDEGMYQCGAENSHGVSFSTGELKVLSFAPNFNRHPLPSVTLVPLGGNMTIPCRVEGAPTPEVQWKKNGGGIGGNMLVDTSFNLIMTSISYGDQGLYTCQADSSLGTASNSTQVKVIEGIVWRRKPAGDDVQVNRTAFIYCEAVYSNSYDLVNTWQFNGRNIDFDLNPEYVVSSSGLHVTHAQYKNSGIYECIVRTTVHSISARAHLQVLGPPSMPAGVYVDDYTVTPRSARVVWTWSEGMEHGADIRSYDIEGESHYHPGEWSVVATDVSDTLAASEALAAGKRDDQRAITVTNLIPNTNYRFRVRATNAYGKGKDASKPSTSRKIAATAPVIPPRNVDGGGGSVGTLTITWDILDPAEHCGDNLRYNVYWTQFDDKNNDWKHEHGDSEMARTEGKLVVEVGLDNFYKQYKVKVGAVNNIGSGPNSSLQVIYSAEDMPLAVPQARYMETYNGTSIIVYWDPVPNNRETIRGKVRGYRVQYFPDFTGETPTDTEPDIILNEVKSKDIYEQTDQMQLVGLYPQTDYLARVIVFNGAGLGPKGEWRRSETAHYMLHSYPTHVEVHQHGEHSVRVKWRGVGVVPGEESLEGYILRVWKLQEDVRTAVDTRTERRVNEAVVGELQNDVVYVLRVLGFSRAGDGALSEAVYFSVQKSGYGQQVSLSIDPTTSEVCFQQGDVRTCGSVRISGWSLLTTIVSALTVWYIYSTE